MRVDDAAADRVDITDLDSTPISTAPRPPKRKARPGWGLDSDTNRPAARKLSVRTPGGRQVLDALGGPAAVSIGHGKPRVDATIARQLAQVAYDPLIQWS